MTDNEIIGAMQQCNGWNGRCLNCPLNSEGTNCKEKLNSYALDLINRQKAEVEGLNDRIFALNDTNKILINSQEIYWRNKVKEFAERLKKVKDDLKYYLDNNEENGVVYIPKFVINNLVKEMTEAKE